MPTRRQIILATSALLGGAAAYTWGSFHSAAGKYEETVRDTWRHSPDGSGIERSNINRELVRYATLAPSSHNTQCWKFRIRDRAIDILPDLTRRCPAVDPDDHHLFVSLGCAAENLLQAAQAFSWRTEVSFESDLVKVSLEPGKRVISPLFEAIPQRQCTRAEYDARKLSDEDLKTLESAGRGQGVNVLLITEPNQVEQFYGVFRQYNTTLCPAQIVLFALAVVAVALVVFPRRWSGVGVSSILAFLWAWIGIAYHLSFFAAINPLAYWFAAVSVLGSLIFLWQGVVRRKLEFRLAANTRTVVGLLLIVFALFVYPAWSVYAGHRYPDLPTFGLPCPTTIFTIGLFGFAVRPYPRSPLAIPVLWSFVGGQAAFLLGVPQDLGLLVAAVVGIYSILKGSIPMGKIDLKKTLKDLYSPSTKEISVVDVPPMVFLAIDGEGDPNTAQTYREAVEALFAVAYAAKFTVKKTAGIDYTVMPLEGLWWADDLAQFSLENKDIWKWTAMIMQPEYVTPEVFEEAKKQVAKKKNLPALQHLRLEEFQEGKSAQILYIGPYANEHSTIASIHDFIHNQGYRLHGKHHEIYLSDPHKTALDKLKTIIRQPFV